jgi:hypothetical protein
MRDPHMCTSKWKGEILQGDNEELDFKTFVTYRRRRREEDKEAQEEKIELERGMKPQSKRKGVRIPITPHSI